MNDEENELLVSDMVMAAHRQAKLIWWVGFACGLLAGLIIDLLVRAFS